MQSLRRRNAARPVLVVAAAVAVATVAAVAAVPGGNGKIAFASNVTGNYEIYLVDPAGGAPVNLTNNEALDRYPAVSPDGQRIAFVSNRDGINEIFVMKIDGTEVSKLLPGANGDTQPAWSPDGKQIAFCRKNDSDLNEIWRLGFDGNDPVSPEKVVAAADAGNARSPAWSPDGSKIAFVGDVTGNDEIWVATIGASGLALVGGNDSSTERAPDWSPDGGQLVFESDRDDGLSRLYVYTVAGGAVNLVPGTESGGFYDPAWSPDGSKLAFSRIASADKDLVIMGTDGTGATVVSGEPGFEEIDAAWQPIPEPPDNRPPVADAGPDGTVECASPEGASVRLDGRASTDPDGQNDIDTYEWFEFYGAPEQELLGVGAELDVVLSLGPHTITLKVTDKGDLSSTDEAVWTVVDTVPPTVDVVPSPHVLWPPNHQMVDVQVEVVARDVCGIPTVTLSSAVSSEPDDVRGGGDGNTVNDIQGADIGEADFALALRAERMGRGPGRIYTLSYTAVDAGGNSASAEGLVYVPHDKGQGGGPGGGNGNGNGHDKDNGTEKEHRKTRRGSGRS